LIASRVDKHPATRYPKFTMNLRLCHRIRRIAHISLVFLFFTQAALAMSGCLMPAAGLAQVMAEVEAAGCSEAGGMNLNLCQAHCVAEHQSLDTGEVPQLSPLHVVVWVVPPFEYTEHPTFTVVRVQRTGDPPIPIRFCSFQI
jgi:hypothetical protein